MSYGIVVEGPYDVSVYEELIRKICSADVEIFSRPAGGVSRLMGSFPKLLRVLEYIRRGRPVDKALVIRDSGVKDPASLEREMTRRITRYAYSFPKGIQFHAVRSEMETWLLADERAVNFVALSRGGSQVAPVQGTLEEIADPKERFIRLLSTVGLPYDAQVCREIARHVELETLRSRCPSFRSFEQKVTDC
ncbi:MAG: DUF4276 family protein [Candidatus Methylomirabilia bacterium]